MKENPDYGKHACTISNIEVDYSNIVPYTLQTPNDIPGAISAVTLEIVCVL